MKKIINPCMCNVCKVRVRGFVEIEYDGGKLSLHGVIGPMSNGNARGSCGQCIDEIRRGTPVEGWDREMLSKLCDIWEEWHLNDMRPYCQHMKELGWVEQMQEEVKVKKWDVTREVRDKARDAERRAIECLKNGETFVPTPEETMYANVGYGVTTYNDELPEHPRFYEFNERDCLGRSNIEYKTRGWIRCEEHELGFLGKKCPVCGYRYGSAWIKEEVPQEVIDWLFGLPDTIVQPAWT